MTDGWCRIARCDGHRRVLAQRLPVFSEWFRGRRRYRRRAGAELYGLQLRISDLNLASALVFVAAHQQLGERTVVFGGELGDGALENPASLVRIAGATG